MKSQEGEVWATAIGWKKTAGISSQMFMPPPSSCCFHFDLARAGREKRVQSYSAPPPPPASCSAFLPLGAVRWRQSCTHKGFPCLTVLLISVSVACSSSVTPSSEVLPPPPPSRTKGREISLIGHWAGLCPGLSSPSFRGLYLPPVSPCESPQGAL